MAGKKRKPRAGKEGWRPCVGVEGRLLCRQGGRAGASEVGVKTRGGAAAGAGPPGDVPVCCAHTRPPRNHHPGAGRGLRAGSQETRLEQNKEQVRKVKDRALPAGALPQARELLVGREEALDTAEGVEDTREAGSCDLLPGPTFRGMMVVDFMCQLDWAKGGPDSCLSVTAGCVCRGVSEPGRPLANADTIVQSSEGPERTKRQSKGQILSLFLNWDVHLLLPAELELLALRPSDSD